MKINSKKLEIMCAELEITKTELSKRTGISRQNLSTIIGRGTCLPITAAKLAKGLNVDLSEILAE